VGEFSSRCSAFVLAFLPLAASQDAVERVGELFGARRFDLAFEESRAIDDAALRAEWEFQILHEGGDLPGALRAALRGLDGAPAHLRLLHNAVVCSLTLGLGERSVELSQRWGRALESAELSDDERRAQSQVQRRMAHEAEELLDRERAAAQAMGRARATSIALIALASCAVAALAFAPRRRR